MKRRLKGFTLMEMIVVIALFGLIMAGALSLLKPINRVYKDTLEYEGSRATVDNMRMYFEDHLKYSNRLHMYTKVSLDNVIGTTGVKGIGITRIDGDSSVSLSNFNAVEYLRKKFIIGDSNRVSNTDDRVYIIYVDNPEDITADVDRDDSTNRGKITMYIFENGTEVLSERRTLSDEAYKEYTFDFNLGEPIAAEGTVTNTTGDVVYGYKQYTQFRPENFAVTIDIYKNNVNASVYKAEDLFNPSVMTFSLINIFGKNSSLLDETIEYKYTDSLGAIKDGKMSIPRYGFYEGTQDTKDIFFVFTKPSIIE